MQPTGVREPERARERFGTGAPKAGWRGKEAVAAAGVVVLLAHLLLAQVTLLLTGCLLAAGRASRWRPAWLAVPAAAGLLWVAVTGPGRAIAGFTAGADQLAGFLAGRGGGVGRVLASPAAAFAGWRQWLPRQLPIALIAAAAEAALISLPGRRRRYFRPGLVSTARQRYARWLAARGQTVTGDGACIGVSESSGARICVSWREVSHGMLLAGREAAALADSGIAVATAAIQRRKAVIVIDVTGSRALGAAIPAAARSAAAPVRRFGSSESGYDPFRAAAPDRACALALAMIDWDGAGAGQRQFCGAYLTAAAQACAAAEGTIAGLDQLISALDPGTLRSLASGGPGFQSAGPGLAARVAELTGRAAADPAPVHWLAAQLAGLRRSALGRRLAPAATGPQGSSPEISIRQLLRRREVALFSLDGRVHGRSAAMIARLALADLIAVLGERAELAAPADCLAWLHGCETADQRMLGRLLELSPLTGTTVLLSTSVPAVAAALAARAEVVLLRGPVPAELGGLPELASLGAGRPAGGSGVGGMAGFGGIGVAGGVAGMAGVAGVAGVAGPQDLAWLSGQAGQPLSASWQHQGAGGRPRRSDDLSVLVRTPDQERHAHGRALEVRQAAAKPLPGHRLRQQLPGSRAVLAGLRAAGRR